MYISKIRLTNFRSFVGEHEIEFNKGINFFVGNNNTGKTTIFKAIEFLQTGKDEKEITKGKESENIAVEVTFSGDDILEIIEEDSLKKYTEYVFDANGTKNIRLLRSSSEDQINQSGKSKTLSIKNVRTWNEETQQFENPTGIDSTITALFDAQFVYSDLKNEDFQDFGKTKIVGKLINAVAGEFQKTESYQNFKQAHDQVFGEGSALKETLNQISNKIETVMSAQYGDAKVEFNFGLPEIDAFLKNGIINMTDNGITTQVHEKGTGMQRALAMSLIQVYAERSNNANSKQLLFFIDEPETFLHPKAQDKLVCALEKIAENSQVFITTHSPYLLKQFKKQNHELKVFSQSKGNKIISGRQMDTFPYSPTWGEINYFAFDVISVEFHNELYGELEKIALKKENISGEKDFNSYLEQKGLDNNNKYIREGKKGVVEQNKTLPVFVRNIIHHPENIHNSYSGENLRKSIELMLRVLKEVK